MMKQTIETSVMTREMKIDLAAKVTKDAQLKCALKMAGAGIQCAVSGVSAVKLATPKALKGKHMADKQLGTSGLSSKDSATFTNKLNDDQTRKYQQLSQFSAPMREAWDSSTEAVFVVPNTEEQSKQQASIDFVEQVSKLQVQLTENLQSTQQKLLESMDAAARAAMPGGR